MKSFALLAPFANCVIVASALLVFFVTPAGAQPSLSTLWPLDMGRVWEFDVRVEGPFDEVAAGIFTQTIVSQTELPSGAAVSCFSVGSTVSPSARPGVPEGLSPLDQRLWMARPDLRAKMSVQKARRIVAQPSLLLALPDCDFDVGLMVDEQIAMGIWSDRVADWAWWWITADPTTGSTFRLQLATEVTNDAFVNGEVRTIGGSVTTPAGSFDNAVIVDYVVEFGESEIVDAGGGVLGTVSFETVGWVAFVPGVGPVASREAFAPAAIDCPTCPPSIFETITTTMELRATTPVRTERLSFGSLKARY